MTPLAALAGLRRTCRGLWDFLIARSADKTAFALERERNAATVAALRQLPCGATLLEFEQGGRMRLIHTPQTPAADNTDALP